MPPTNTEGAEARLLRERIIVLGDAIDDELANEVIAKLLFLEHADATREVTLIIDSPGGSVTASLSLCDVMGEVTSPVSTMCTGAASGSALLVLALGAQGNGSRSRRRSCHSFHSLVGRTLRPKSSADSREP